jgi:hypothetical protein
MKKLEKLTLNEMQSELSVLQLRQCQIIKGGDAGMDCVFHAIAFAAGVSYAQVATAYGDYVESLFNMQDGSDIFADQVNYTGMSGGDTEYLANLFGLSNVGDTPQGAQGYCEMGDQSVALISGINVGHAIVLTGNANGTQYDYYDPQSGECGTIDKDDPRIVQTFGY